MGLRDQEAIWERVEHHAVEIMAQPHGLAYGPGGLEVRWEQRAAYLEGEVTESPVNNYGLTIGGRRLLVPEGERASGFVFQAKNLMTLRALAEALWLLYEKAEAANLGQIDWPEGAGPRKLAISPRRGRRRNTPAA
jgi:hypothetical protein